MDHAEFMSAIIEYYGPYKSEFVEDVILGYVRDRFQESELESIFKRVIAFHSNQFKTPPDVNVFERLTMDSSVDIAAEGRREFQRILSSMNIYRDLICEDVCVQAALRDCDGHRAICNCDPLRDLPFVEKKFIESYIYYRKHVPDSPVRPSAGIGDGFNPVILKSLRGHHQVEHQEGGESRISDIANSLTNALTERDNAN